VTKYEKTKYTQAEIDEMIRSHEAAWGNATTNPPKMANIYEFPDKFSRKEVYTFPEGSVTIEVNDSEPALNVKTAIYFLSNVVHQIHRMMEPDRD
jgi:hypothetical protein